MSPHAWQKSSYCQEGDACVHISADPDPKAIRLIESADPAQTVLTTTPTAFAALLDALSAP
ncbi:DUF397 domain-containing protein [Streptomyces sp. NBC_01235]|uniref:DUF397 domain-containing protein n=1 Tax=Streptomyces sp. NBC_01235 TaxID=2903788 RepID=UPI002E15BB2F|nr:DUF397 domain-containing protein [Streptomyces sp. NBC_01235]